MAASLQALIVSAVLVVGGCERAQQTDGASITPAEAPAAAQLWTCGMHPQVLQDRPGACPICGMELTPVKAPSGDAAPQERKVRYWWDPMMNPPYVADRPGKSPMGMDLVPVYEDEVSAGPAVVIDPVVVQNMGVRTAVATEGPLRVEVRAVGFLEEAEPNQHDVNLRVSGWIERLYANTEGMHLSKGDPLFDLYSPELQVAVGELIAARRARAAVGEGAEDRERRPAASLYGAAAQKLALLGLTEAQTQRLATLERAPRTVTFVSPIAGHLVEKTIVEGAAVSAGERVMRIVDHGTLWLDAQVYEKDLPYVRTGQHGRATVQSIAGEPFEGEIIFVHPHVDAETRTARVRVELANPSLRLRPGMYGTVTIVAEISPRALLVPREAVIDTGTRHVAFVSLDHGRFEPRRLSIGASGSDGMVQVLAGLAPGEAVVTSGQFLLDAESRMKEAVEKFLAAKLLQPGATLPDGADGRADGEPSRDSHDH
jgi:Cu(I)/Ag(I) efflux system membrane fusion protein/cobalt-zinc-cadmium efflux system membrane fusion protein